jgi:uncharacterized lipoprotein YddW (UPF0748 family)
MRDRRQRAYSLPCYKLPVKVSYLASALAAIVIASPVLLIYMQQRRLRKPEVLGVYAYMYKFPDRSSPADWGELLAKLKSAGASIVLPFVIDASGYAYYNSSIVPRNEAYMRRYRGDPLRDLVERAHRSGVKVYAWVVIGRASRVVLEEHPEWAVYDVSGKSCLEKATPSGFLYLNPAVSGAREYVKSYVREIVEKYEVDGVVWEDDLGWPPYSDWGYGPLTREAFASWLGAPDLKWPEDVAEGGRYRGKFIEWRVQVVTNFACELYRTVKSAKNIPVGAAVSPGLSWQKQLMGVDWVEWARRGCVDFLSPMVYHRDEQQPPIWVYWSLKDVRKALEGANVELVPSVGGSLANTGSMPPAEWVEAVGWAAEAGANRVFVFADVCLDRAGAWEALGAFMRG